MSMTASGSAAQPPQVRETSKKKRRSKALPSDFRVSLSDTSLSTKGSEPLAATPKNTTLVVQKDLTTQQRAPALPSAVPYADIC